MESYWCVVQFENPEPSREVKAIHGLFETQDEADEWLVNQGWFTGAEFVLTIPLTAKGRDARPL